MHSAYPTMRFDVDLIGRRGPTFPSLFITIPPYSSSPSSYLQPEIYFCPCLHFVHGFVYYSRSSYPLRLGTAKGFTSCPSWICSNPLHRIIPNRERNANIFIKTKTKTRTTPVVMQNDVEIFVNNKSVLTKDDVKELDKNARRSLAKFCALKGIFPRWCHTPYDKAHYTRVCIPLPPDLQQISGHKEFSVGGKARTKKHTFTLAAMMAIQWLKTNAQCDVHELVRQAHLAATKNTLQYDMVIAKAFNRTLPGIDIAQLSQAVHHDERSPESQRQINTLIRVINLVANEPPKVKYFTTQAKGERRLVVNVYCNVTLPSDGDSFVIAEKPSPSENISTEITRLNNGHSNDTDPFNTKSSMSDTQHRLIGTAFGDSSVSDHYVEAMAFKSLALKLRRILGKEIFHQYYCKADRYPQMALTTLNVHLVNTHRLMLQDSLVILEKAVRKFMQKRVQISFKDLTSSQSSIYSAPQRFPALAPSNVGFPNYTVLPKAIANKRQYLPVDELRSDLIQALNASSSVLIVGGTGSGKTTRIPQFILDHALESGQGNKCKIIITQPRRIAVIAASTRVAAERGEELGQPNASVGYHIRLERKPPRPKACIEFVTTGLLLRRLQNQYELDDVSHVIIDEVHERDKDTDLLLIILKEMMLTKQCNIKLLVMSATLDQVALHRYLDNCPLISVPTNSLFPVREVFLDDIRPLVIEKVKKRQPPPQPVSYNGKICTDPRVSPIMDVSRANSVDLVMTAKMREQEILKETAQTGGLIRTTFLNNKSALSDGESYDVTLCRIMAQLLFTIIKNKQVPTADVSGGAILCFLPGWDEIQLVRKLFAEKMGSLRSSTVILHVLHSTVSSNEQRKAFSPVPISNIKVILATNIAETSLTIDDVTVVIDSGRVREMRWHPTSKFTSLDSIYCSKASATQRLGRAGRLRPGICYRLYSKEIAERAMLNYDVPEMLRCSLDSLILQAKALTLSPVEEFLEKALNPPNCARVRLALEELFATGALRRSSEGPSEELTALGWHMSAIPLEPYLARTVILGVMLCAVEPALAIGACLSNPEIFNSFALKENGNIMAQLNSESDVLALISAYEEYTHIQGTQGNDRAREFAEQYKLNISTMKMITETIGQLKNALGARGFFDGKSVSELNSNSMRMSVRKFLVCSAVTNLAHRVGESKEVLTRAGVNALVYPSSVAAKQQGISGRAAWYCYLELMQTKKMNIKFNTVACPLEIMLLCGISMRKDATFGWLIDEWISCKGDSKDLDLLVGARRAIAVVLQEFCQQPRTQLPMESKQFFDVVLILLEQV